MDALDLDIRSVRSLHAIACGPTRLTWLRDAARFELAMRRHDRAVEINSYNDPPKSLPDLQDAVSTPGPGYHKHHIAEQGEARKDGFPEEVIDDPSNLVRIPKMKHEEITGWYQRKNPEFDGMPPREYLSGRSWEVRRSVGLDALRRFGVLKP
jgi:hypothetical protein